MTASRVTVEDFFKNSDLAPEDARRLVTEALADADYGELYQEIVETENVIKDMGAYTRISTGDSSSGFGMRVGQEERVGYAFSSDFNRAALTDAIRQARQVVVTGKTPAARPAFGRSAAALYKEERVTDAIRQARQVVVTGKTPAARPAFGRSAAALYKAENPIKTMSLADKLAKIDAIEAYARSLDPEAVTNVTVSYSAIAQAVHIITSDGQSLVDVRPRVGLSLQVTVKDAHGKIEVGTASLGGPIDIADLFDDTACKEAVDKAYQQAKTLLIAQDAPAGVMDVVLGSGWAGVILHEAVGHGLEGDFNRRGISAYSGKIGQQVAPSIVTVIEQGDLPGERGSLHFDDEGIPTQRNVLIENGILMGYMQDRQNAQLMQAPLTGNGRRQSFAHLPMPRMTNTYFGNGTHDPADIIAGVKDGIYISDMGGGQVDITSGRFNMNAKLAWRIRDGKLCEPLKGATLIGDGLTVIQSITKVGNDLKLERSAGMCGKNGQSVPVGIGQPTICVANMTVGGNKRI